MEPTNEQRSEYARWIAGKRKKEQRRCAECGAEFETIASRGRDVCSTRCYMRRYRRRAARQEPRP